MLVRQLWLLPLMVGKRRNYGKKEFLHTIYLLQFWVQGLLWFGWFGFNAGSALGANTIAVSASLLPHAAAATGGAVWAFLEWLFNGKPTVFGTITGSVAGLATVTPAAGFVSPIAGMAIGVIASLVCFVFCSLCES